MIPGSQGKKTVVRRAALMAAAILALCAAPVPLRAAALPLPEAAAETQSSTEDLKALLSALDNPAEREKLASQLRAMIAAREAQKPGAGEQMFATISNAVSGASQQITDAAQALVDVRAVFGFLGRQAGDPDRRAAVGALAVKLLIVIGLGWAAQFGARAALTRPRRAAESLGAQGGFLRWGMRLAYVALDVAPVIVFAAVAYTALPFTKPDNATQAVAIAVVNAFVLLRAVLIVAGVILSPDATSLRLLPIEDETANYLFIWVRRLFGTAIYGYFAAEAAHVLGMHNSGYNAVLNALGLAVTLMSVILILQNRRLVSARIRGRRASEPTSAKPGPLDTFRAIVADIWHVLAIFYLAALYFVWALRVPGGFSFVLTATVLTVVIVLMSQLAAAIIDRVVAKGFSVNEDVRRRFPSLEARANNYLPGLLGTAKSIIYVLAALALLQVWGMPSLSWVTAGAGRQFVTTVGSIAVVLLVAGLVWEGATVYMESQLLRGEDQHGSAERGARVKTLLPLFRKFLFMLLAVVVGLIVLAQLGINIAPLLAGAGIVGLAIAVGAQKLVQDVLNGLFIFLDAAVSEGDFVELAGHAGYVEATSLKSIRLRDLEGNVHTIPCSAVSTVLNRTKGFSYYMFDLGIGYGEDIDRVIATLKEIGADMRRDKDMGPLISDDLEVLGLDRFAEIAIMIKARIKTLPGKQWIVGREFNRRIKRRFDELKIEMPFPQRPVVVNVGGPHADAAPEDSH